jgi:predicted cupin superfamily sugar epimerase
MTEAADVIESLGLVAPPEGGWFRETWRAPAPAGERAAGTAIYYLLADGERSHWHRVDATEVWHFYAGDALYLECSADGAAIETVVLGSDITRGHRPQHVVPPGAWQAARSDGAWSLVGCTVAPAFEFGGFELARAGWRPGS